MSSDKEDKKEDSLKKYRKEESLKGESHTRSILITKTQAEFLDREKINLSKLIRDFLDRLIEDKGA